MEGSYNIFIGEEEEEKDTNGKINEFSIREGEGKLYEIFILSSVNLSSKLPVSHRVSSLSPSKATCFLVLQEPPSHSTLLEVLLP